MSPVASLIPTMLSIAASRKTHQYVTGGTSRHVVKDLLDIDRLRYRLEVLIQTFLGWFVVIRCHQQASVSAGRFGAFGELIASEVELAPVPAISGTRPPTILTASAITSACSGCESVADSPVVPTETMAFVPGRYGTRLARGRRRSRRCRHPPWVLPQRPCCLCTSGPSYPFKVTAHGSALRQVRQLSRCRSQTLERPLFLRQKGRGNRYTLGPMRNFSRLSRRPRQTWAGL